MTGDSGGEETGENAQLLGPPPVGLTARLHENSEIRVQSRPFRGCLRGGR
ncbi:hypothetical protein EMIT07CA2_30502 [Brevibacillus sp. IT-7CA2]